MQVLVDTTSLDPLLSTCKYSVHYHISKGRNVTQLISVFLNTVTSFKSKKQKTLLIRLKNGVRILFSWVTQTYIFKGTPMGAGCPLFRKSVEHCVMLIGLQRCSWTLHPQVWYVILCVQIQWNVFSFDHYYRICLVISFFFLTVDLSRNLFILFSPHMVTL